MIYRTSKEEIDAYYADSESINQSAHKVILTQGVQAFVLQQQEILSTDELYQEEKEHFLIGKGVDCIITEGMAAFKERYHYNELLKKPGEKPMLMIKQLYDRLVVRGEPYAIRDNMKANNMPFDEAAVEWSDQIPSPIPAELRPLHFFKKELYDLMDTVTDSKGNVGFYLNNKIPSDKLIKGEPDTRTWLDDKRANTRMFNAFPCHNYWQDLIKAKGKQILTQEQYECINRVSNSFLQHPFTSYLFNDEDYKGEEIDIVYQLILYWTEEVPIVKNGKIEIVKQACKAMIDTCIFNHTRRWIIPLDEKTTRYPITMFNKQIRARRYDLQGAWYTKGIYMAKGTIENLINRDIGNYDIQNFAFVAESTTSPGTPLIFPLTTELLEVGEKGDGEDLEGYSQALKKYCTYKAHDFLVSGLTDNGIVWVDNEFKTDLLI